MKFNDDGICILESLTDPYECDAYIEFLRLERVRHLRGHNYARSVSADKRRAANKFYAAALYWDSATVRHQQDIDGIDRLIPKIQAYKETLCKSGT